MRPLKRYGMFDIKPLPPQEIYTPGPCTDNKLFEPMESDEDPTLANRNDQITVNYTLKSEFTDKAKDIVNMP